jgi:hypothetical protein
MSKSWTLDVQENKDGELFIELNDEILEGSGFKIGDDLLWTDNKDGSFTLTKSDKVWVLVEAVQMYRMRYMVQVPATNPEWAMDDVTMQTAKEFSQLDIGETISSHRVVSHDEALKLCDEDNDYTKDWTEEQKIRAFFTKNGEKRDY